MLDEAKKQLAGSIQKIKENSTLAANEVYDITRNRIEALETAHQEVRLFCSNTQYTLLSRNIRAYIYVAINP